MSDREIDIAHSPGLMWENVKSCERECFAQWGAMVTGRPIQSISARILRWLRRLCGVWRNSSKSLSNNLPGFNETLIIHVVQYFEEAMIMDSLIGRPGQHCDRKFHFFVHQLLSWWLAGQRRYAPTLSYQYSRPLFVLCGGALHQE